MDLNVLDVLALAAVSLYLGKAVHRLFPITEKYSLPGAVLGGLLMAGALGIIEKTFSIEINLNTSAQTPLMVAFFSSLGFGASWLALKAGGKKVVSFFIVCVGLLLLQNMIGILTAVAMGQSPLFGVITSSVSLVGGPGTALAFAPLFAESGLADAGTIGVTAAMAGILIAGLVGGPASTWLIQRDKLNSDSKLQTSGFKSVCDQETKYSSSVLMAEITRQGILLLVVMALGAYVAQGLSQIGLTFPIYIGSMIVAAVIRNVDDKYKFVKINESFLDALASWALSLFIAMSLMSLQWSKLTEVAGPILIALIVQTLVVVGVSVTLIYKWYGKNYEAAVLSGGVIGFMMGTTANAMANLESVTKKYGPAPFAYFVIPLIGACFIDFANAAVISIFVNILK